MLRLISYFVFAVALAYAQSTGGVSGTVSDQTGAALANAEIAVTNSATGVRQTIRTNEAGLYQLPSLQPGTYTITADAPGLQTTVVNGVVVAVGTTTRQDLTMAVASNSQRLEIQATAPVLETSSVSVGSVVDQRTVQEIPLNGRHFVDLAQLVPGTVTPPQSGSLTAPLRGQGSFSFNSAGAREDTVNFMINGINMNDIAQNQITFQPTVNTVAEFKIDNSTFSAEYGRNSGSIVNIATRGGTNEWHGEAYNYLRNEALDARNFANPIGVQQSPFKRNQFGGDAGFPIKKDNSFLFLSYEQLKQRQSVPLSTTVLTQAQRAQGLATSDPVIRSLIPLIPQPNSATGSVFTGNAVAPVDIYQGTANFSQNFGTANRLNAFYAMQQDQRNEPPTTQGNNLPGFGDTRHGVRQLLTITDTHTISPTLVNEARVGYNRIKIVFAAANTLNAADLGISSGVDAPIGLPQITVTNAFAFGGLNGFPQGRGDVTAVASDTLSWVKGNQTIKIGGEYRQAIANSFSQTPGTFTFPTISAFLADQASSFSANSSNRAARIYIPAIGAFVQDAYRVRPNLTVTLGVRYDWNGTPYDTRNHFVVFDPTTDSLVNVGRNGGPQYAYQQSALNFTPRVGLAWTLDSKTVLRSAYAVFVDQPNANVVSGLVSNPPYAIPVTFTGTSSLTNAYSLAGGAISPTSVAQNYRNANVQSWNFNLQRELAAGYSVQASYVGSKGTHLNIARNYNQPVNGVRPYLRLSAASPITPSAALGNITVNESVGNSSYQALWVTVAKHFAKNLQFTGVYTWSKSIDYNSRNFQGVVVQDSYNLRGDRGLSDFDARHRFVLSGIYQLPFTANRLVSGWQISLIQTLQSGNPFSIRTTNASLTGFANIRASVRGPVNLGYYPATNGNATFVGYIPNDLSGNSSIFDQGAAFGNLGRNVFIGPGFVNLDLSLVKNTKLTERLNLQFRADAFDALNQTNFGQPNTVYSRNSTTFGLISGTRFPTGDSGTSRQLQLALKLMF